MNLRERLKIETKTVHDSLEAKLDLMRENLTLADYKNLLIKFYAFYQCLKYFWQDDRLILKIRHLEEDLNYLDVPQDKLKIPASLDGLNPQTPAEILGTRYVIEGSNLGGLVLSKHFSKKFHFSDGRGLQFFSGYGHETIPLWMSFLKELEESSHSQNLNEDQIIAAAHSIFISLEKWLLFSE